MLPVSKDEEEDQVLRALVEHLVKNSVLANFIEAPDRLPELGRTYASVTSDGLLRLGKDASWWAVDVMSLAQPASYYIVPSGLQDRLTAIAEKHSLIITVEGEIPQPADLKPIEKAVYTAISLGSPKQPVKIAGLSISWRTPSQDEEPCVQFSLLLAAPSPLLFEQVAATIRAPLLKKATEQARRAKESGCNTAVLLDALGHAGIAQGTHWLPQHPATFRQAVEDVFDGTTHSLDAVLLLDRSGQWHLLYGEFPSFAPDSSGTSS